MFCYDTVLQMTKKRVLVAHPRVTASGGGNAVAAWTLQALREHCDLSLATLQPLDYEAINRSWGTSLREGDFRVHLAPARYLCLLRSFPTPGALLEACLTVRLAQNLDRLRHYDVLWSTQNEMDFGRRGIHYVHHPWVYLPRPKDELRWYHYVPGSLHLYRQLCRRISRGTNAGLRRNLSIANSTFIAYRIRQVHGVDSVIVFPPVTSDFPDTSWEHRESALVAVGRLNGCKRWEMAVQIVEELRRRGYDLALTLIGHRDDAEYERRLQQLAATRPWFRLRLNLTRDELKIALVSHRYGIHTMENEHFGMGPAEIVRAGCLLFAHNSGGPVEIVRGESRLLFDDVTDAADKIERVISNAALETELRTGLEARRTLFTAETFCAALREIVDRFE
jgi:glycosyltransferase involved in cell wall biosynthesis